ncbi:MAG: metallophosphoesterase [Candidatus Kapabacteria bacterium]|nr:metallophosphoesterase [Ignavibacteria bacterium]MBP6509172.1 metallophosphoesterase [Candidatus Kapabacteria bacterium]MBK6418621.1 metallophosphoesterase [Ignavibacteria bacterium]MBK7411632.1 metallophosphoesterase [Ignavibacteria bacterium]MBL0322690.1 metallophosphoesterase [Ignavibacteria bacterium]
MNNQPNVLLFSVILGAVFLLLDVYVLGHWTAYVRRKGMNPGWHRSMWIVAAVMITLYVVAVSRRNFFRLDGLDVVLLGISTFWYLPKLGIAPVLFVRDIMRGFARLFRRPERRGEATPRPHSEATPRPHSEAENHPERSRGTDPARRTFLANSAWSLSAVPYVMVGNGMWRTLYDFQTVSLDLNIRKLPRAFDGMRIAQISDIHAGSFPDHRPFEEVRRILDVLKPDAIVITGDFVNAKPSEMSVIARELAQLKAPYGVFASLGNHDHYNTPQEHAELVKTIRGVGVDLLVNENRRIVDGGSSLIIAGTDNTGFKQSFAKIDRALNGVLEDEATILLAHDPTYWDKAIVGATNVDVMLSGHTHGGQFGVQLLGFEWSPAQYVYKQWAGLYGAGEQLLYVNRGIGTVGPPLRIGIPPEVTIFTLRASSIADGLA